MHEIGPYRLNQNDEIENKEYSIVVTEPAILFDKEALVTHKIGNAEFVNRRYQKIVASLVSQTNDYSKSLANDLLVITFDMDRFTKDDICTIFNTVLNCTATPLLESVVNNDYAEMKEHIARMQNIGY